MEYTKLVQTGGVIEIYEYEKRPFRMSGVAQQRTPKSRVSHRRYTRRIDSINRASKSFRRLVYGNVSKSAPALLTLTMLDLVDVRIAYKRYTAFGQRVRRIFGKDVAWCAVPEFQKRGSVHFHVLIWNLPYDVVEHERSTRRIQGIWRWGYVDICQTDGSGKLASYLTKYLSKAMSDARLVGVKAYSATRNIMRPVSVSSVTAVSEVLQEWKLGVDNFLVFQRSYDTLWLGRCVYRRYSVNKNG